MPRGGLRVGAGRKPGQKRGVVLGMNGARLAASPPPIAVDESHPLNEPPIGLPRAEQAVWRRLAPYAIAQQTLTAATVAGFSELCEQAVFKAGLSKAIAKEGVASDDADRLLRQYAKLAQRFDQSLARFRLTGSGKPDAAAGVKKPAANPWATVAGAKTRGA